MSSAPGDTDAVDDLIERAEDYLLAGDALVAKALAEEAFALVTEATLWHRVPETAGLLGHTCALVGEIQRAEASYYAAGECQRGLAEADVHLYGRPGARWGWYLRTTYRLSLIHI